MKLKALKTSPGDETCNAPTASMTSYHLARLLHVVSDFLDLAEGRVWTWRRTLGVVTAGNQQRLRVKKRQLTVFEAALDGQRWNRRNSKLENAPTDVDMSARSGVCFR